MPIRLLLAALAATASLAACGGDPQKPAADREAAARKAMLAYAACMRSHGVAMQDPQFNSDGGVTLNSGGPGAKDNASPETQRKAQAACAHFMREIKAPGGNSPAQQAEFRKAALANSRCMRTHGVPNFPDPKFGANGQVSIKISKGSGIDPRSPAFQNAQKACAKYRPKRVVGG
jgi:hypothetical protein